MKILTLSSWVALVGLTACTKADDVTAGFEPPVDEQHTKDGAASARQPRAKAETEPEGGYTATAVVSAPVEKLEVVELAGKAPKGFDVGGAIQSTLGWKDKHGLNILVIARGDSDRHSMLTIRHARPAGDGRWTDVRVFKDRVSECDFDVTLAAKTGPWSVTDLDDDGVGEATFAYSLGCRSDVSPVAHKVLMTEDGEKWALRGSTLLDPGDGPMGGEFEADFKGAPAAFQAHAEKAWKLTATEF